MGDTLKIPLITKLMLNSPINRIIENDNDDSVMSRSIKLSVANSEISNNSLVSAGSSNISNIYFK